MKLIPLKPGYCGATESGVPQTGDIAVIMTDVYGNPVVHKSGVPAIGETVYLGTSDDGKPVAIRKGGFLQDPVVDYIWSDATGQFIYFFYYHPFIDPYKVFADSFQTYPLTVHSYQTGGAASRFWFQMYLDIRMHQVDTPLPDIMANSTDLPDYTGSWGKHLLYYEFNRTFTSGYYGPGLWDQHFWNNDYEGEYNGMIVTTMYPTSYYNIGPSQGCFGAMFVGKLPSAYVNMKFSNINPYLEISKPSMYTNDPIIRYGYPSGRLQLDYEVTEMLHLDPERKSQSTEYLSGSYLSLVPIKRISFYGDGIERHDQWGTVWAYGWWRNSPAVGYHKTIQSIGHPDISGALDIHTSSWPWHEEYEDCGDFIPNHVVINPFSFPLSDSSDTQTFPSRGLIMLSTIGDIILEKNMHEQVGGWSHSRYFLGENDTEVRQFGIYDGKSGLGLSNMQVVGYPANSYNHFYVAVGVTPMRYLTGLIDKYARVELTHTIISGPHRITNFTVEVGGVLKNTNPLITWVWAYIYNIKIAGISEIPPFGFFLYVGKKTKGTNAGKIYEMAMYYYQVEGDHFNCRSVEIPGMLSKVPSGYGNDESSWPYFYDSRTRSRVTFLGMMYEKWGFGRDIHNVEVPTDNECQGYIYIVNEMIGNLEMRFYHDARFSGVQMPFWDPIIIIDDPFLQIILIIKVTVRRVVSTCTTTYILYKFGDADGGGDNRLWKVNLPHQFYTDVQYAAGRFPKVYGDNISIPSGYKFKEIVSWSDYNCLMYISDSTQELLQTPKPPYIAAYGTCGFVYLCQLPGPKVDPIYLSYRFVSSNESASYSAPSNQDTAFLLIPENVVIIHRITHKIVSFSRIYSLYRITMHGNVYRYAFNPGGFIPSGDGSVDFYPVLQIVCYDTNEVEEGEEVSEDDEDPGIVHMILRYKHPEYKYYNNHTYREVSTNIPVSCMKQISIPHSSFEKVW